MAASFPSNQVQYPQIPGYQHLSDPKAHAIAINAGLVDAVTPVKFQGTELVPCLY